MDHTVGPFMMDYLLFKALWEIHVKPTQAKITIIKGEAWMSWMSTLPVAFYLASRKITTMPSIIEHDSKGLDTRTTDSGGGFPAQLFPDDKILFPPLT